MVGTCWVNLSMMRTLVTVGLIAGFITCAFVPPTDANFASLTEMAKTQVKERTLGSLLPSEIDAADVKKAADALKKVANDPRTADMVKKLGTSQNSLSDVIVAADVLKSVAPSPKKVAKVAAAFVPKTAHTFTMSWKQRKKATEDQAFLKQLDRIEWAARKEDVRLCKDTMAQKDGGDFLALCLAIVAKEPLRCKQIDEESPHALQKTCFDEVAS